MDSKNYTIPKITALGIGGAGCNAINHIVDCEIENVKFIASNTDSQALLNSTADQIIYLGPKLLKGLGAGSNSEAGKKAALESEKEIKEAIKDTDLLFLICGLGGGTGTGATPVIAKIAKELNILVVTLVTKPFTFEGALRLANSEKGIEEIRETTDSLIVYSNDKLLEELGEIPLQESFDFANDNLRKVVESFVDIIISPSMVNLDFSDVKKLLKNSKNTFFGFGVAEGTGKATAAAKEVVSCKFLEASIKGAKRALVYVVGGQSTSLFDVREAIEYIKNKSGRDINIEFGQKTNKELKEKMIISLIAVEFDETEIKYANLENIARKSKIKKIEEQSLKEKGGFLNDESYIDYKNFDNNHKNKEKKENDDEDDDLPSFMK